MERKETIDDKIKRWMGIWPDLEGKDKQKVAEIGSWREKQINDIRETLRKINERQNENK